MTNSKLFCTFCVKIYRKDGLLKWLASMKLNSAVSVIDAYTCSCSKHDVFSKKGREVFNRRDKFVVDHNKQNISNMDDL